MTNLSEQAFAAAFGASLVSATVDIERGGLLVWNWHGIDNTRSASDGEVMTLAEKRADCWDVWAERGAVLVEARAAA